MSYGLSAGTIDRINGVLAHFPEIEKALLYGSRAKGNYKPGSDVDLALVGAALSLQLLARINNELDDLLLPYKVDTLILAKVTHQDLLDHIERVGRLFYERNVTPIQP